MSTEQDLGGKCALITGGAKRIGAAIAQSLHQRGANVAVHYRSSADEASALCNSLNAARPNSAKGFAADLIVTDEVESLVSQVLEWQRRLDILVNNASTFYPTPFGNIADAEFDDLVGSNLKAPLFLAQAAANHLRKASGSIVNIIDIHARRPLRDHMVYVSAKAALEMLTKSLAKELAPGVRVNGIAPGAIAWPEDGMDDATKEMILKRVPLGRTGAPGDIASAVLYLVRDATYSTGQILPVDGGRSISW